MSLVLQNHKRIRLLTNVFDDVMRSIWIPKSHRSLKTYLRGTPTFQYLSMLMSVPHILSSSRST